MVIVLLNTCQGQSVFQRSSTCWVLWEPAGQRAHQVVSCEGLERSWWPTFDNVLLLLKPPAGKPMRQITLNFGKPKFGYPFMLDIRVSLKPHWDISTLNLKERDISCSCRSHLFSRFFWGALWENVDAKGSSIPKRKILMSQFIIKIFLHLNSWEDV